MTSPCNQWIRRIELILYGVTPTNGLDLSAFRIKFTIQNADVETPNCASIRVYNLASSTLQSIVELANQGEFSQVVLNAGYANGAFGAVFIGTVKQYRIGKENNKETFLDILASDGDLGYNQGAINQVKAAGTNPVQILAALQKAIVPGTKVDDSALTSGALPNPCIRGVVLFGMARAGMRDLADTLSSSWSIQNGQMVVIKNTGYAYKDEIVPAINVATGMIGTPEQTEEGVKVTCLLNPNIRIGGRIYLNNADVLQTSAALGNEAAIAFNSRTNLNYFVPLSKDQYYRAYVVEHEGDTRGNQWYTHIVALAVTPSAKNSLYVQNA